MKTTPRIRAATGLARAERKASRYVTPRRGAAISTI
jgi:hypothetical protein